MKRIALVVTLVLGMASWRAASAASIKIWEFDTPTNYVFDPQVVEVSNSQARLVLQAQTFAQAEYSVYTNQTTTVRLAYDESANVLLSRAVTAFSSNGVFTSRIFSGVAATPWTYLSVAAGYDPNFTDPSVLSRYAMENDNWLDRATGRFATPSGVIGFTTDSAAGTYAGAFNGGYLLPPSNPFFGLRGFTIACWIKASSYSQWRSVLAGQIGNIYILLRQETGQKLNFGFTTTIGFGDASVSLPLNTYIHVVATWQGDSADAGMRSPRIYVNGQLGAQGSACSGTLNYSSTIGIGCAQNGGIDRAWMGNIDDLVFLSRGVSAFEALKLYEGESDLFRPVRVQVRSAPSEALIQDRAFVGADGTSNTFYSVGTSLLVPAPEFNAFDPYVQYRAHLRTDRNQQLTPYLRSVGLFGDGLAAWDKNLPDFQLGSLSANTTLAPSAKDSPFIGLAKKANGGYYTNAVYESRVFDAGVSSRWKQLDWKLVKELSSNIPGLIALWHMNDTWVDSKGAFTLNSPPNRSFTVMAKAGSASALFNGVGNQVSGFGAIPSVQTIEFWIQDDQVNDEVLGLASGLSIRIVDGSIQLVGAAPGRAVTYVNGSCLSPRLLPGWNHVAIVFSGGATLTDLNVGEIPLVGFMQGKLDELALYNRALNAGEISEHYVLGQRESGGRVRLQVSDASLTNFVGPGGLVGTFFTVPPADTAEGNLLGTISDQQQIRYRIILDGEGDATPIVNAVGLLVSSPTVRTYRDDTVDAFKQGSFVRRQSQVYGGRISFDDEAVPWPVYATPVMPVAVGVWHFDDLDWAGVQAVRAELGGAGGAVGDAHPSYDARVGLRSGSFDGNGDYVDGLTTTLSLEANDFTLSLWFKTTAGTTAPLLSAADAGAYVALRVHSDSTSSTVGAAALAVNDGSGEKLLVSQRRNLNDNSWHHLAGMRNGNQLLVYVDGEREGSLLVPGLGNCGTTPSFIVAKRTGTNLFYRGLIDEVAVHRRALTEGDLGELLAGASRGRSDGVYESSVLSRSDPSIWPQMQWVPMAPYGQPLQPSADELSLMGLWHFDEPGGSVVSNAVVANGMNGTVTGATFGHLGRFGRALDFNAGGSQFVQIQHNARLEPLPPNLSIEAWVSMDFIDSRCILAKRSGANGYSLYTDSTGRPVFSIGSSVVTGPIPLRAGKWTHLVGMYNSARLRLSLYVDGSAVADGPSAGSLVSGADLQIGRSQVPDGYFDGRIDEVAIHARALNTEEILDHYRAGAVTAKIQVRTSMTNSFAQPFVGPGRSTNTYFTLSQGSDLTADIDAGINFQYRCVFQSEDRRYPPDLRGFDVLAAGYPLNNPTIYPASEDGFQFPGHLLRLEHLRINNPNTDVKYQISGDSGDTPRWFYWDGGKWTQEQPLSFDVYTFQANQLVDITNNIGRFYNDLYNKTGGLFRFRAFLHSQGESQAALEWVRLTASDGRIVVSSPDGQENADRSWLVGVPYDITWDYTTNLTGTVKIQFSANGGGGWGDLTPAANAVPISSRLQNWITPTTPTTQALIRITYNPDGTINDRSDSTFTLQQGLQIAEHNGGTNLWYIGETNSIVWRKSTQAFPGFLEFSNDGTFTGNQVRITATTVGPNSINTYDWVTPLTNANLVAEAGKLRVIEQRQLYSDVSDGPFTMAGGVVVAPEPGQGVKKDALFNLQWVSAGMGPQVSIEIQTEPGGPWDLITPSAPNVPGLNAYAWMPTNNPTENARIRLQSLTDPRAKGLTQPFTIAAVELVRPVGNPDLSLSDLWLQHTTQSIAWISGGASSNVNLSFSTNSGVDFMTITNGYPNLNGFGITNTYNWIVRPFPSETVRMRVEDAVRPDTLFSVSPYDFQIAGLRIATPNGSPEYWDKGVLQNIRWEENAVGIEGTIDFSDNNGATWSQVAQGPLLGNLEQIYTPTNPTIHALVRIRADAPAPFTNIVDLSDTQFSVAGIRVVRPDPASLFTIGTTNAITFVIAATRDPDGFAQIYYAGDGVNFDLGNPLNSSFPIIDDGSVNIFTWTIDASRRPSQNARIRVKAGPPENPYIGDSEPFTVRGIKFDSPLGGTIWAPGLHDVRWTFAGIAFDARADIYVSLNGGLPGSYTNRIVQNVGVADSTASWTVPFGLGPSTNARLRMVVVSSTQVPADIGFTAESSVFTLQGIRVLSPVTGMKWDMGSTQPVIWDAASGGSPVDLSYSSDGGLTFESRLIQGFVASADGTNGFPWAIDMARTPSSNAVVRVASRTYPGIFGSSLPFAVRGIKVTRPTASDIYATTDFTNVINWTAYNAEGPNVFSLSYIVDGGAPQPIASGVSGRTYNWSPIPPGAISTNVRIRVSDGIHANTSSVFRVVNQPAISIAAPSRGEFLGIGDVYPIQWNRGGSMGNSFTVSYSRAPYTITNLITTGTGITFDETNNVYTYHWEVPDQPTQAVIIVQHNDVDRQNVRDVSGVFNISGRFHLLNPPGPFDIYALKPNTTIRWETLGSVAFVDLYCSLSDQHEASSWTKINAQPIANTTRSYNPGDPAGSWSPSTYPWTVVNARTTHAAVRVQEATYPQKFDQGDTGPFGDSADFPINYYTVYWDVYDSLTGNLFNSPTGRLDHLSIVDSSGWGQADASAIPPRVISNDYPWGTFNTEIYREGFFDASLLFWQSENLTMGGPQSWTQHVALARSMITAEYHVLANFSYDTASTNFTIHTWMERGGVILASPTSSKLKIYDQAGTQIDEITSSSPSENGVFWMPWNATGRTPGSVYFAKVEILYSGSVYSSGLTFTLTIPISDEIRSSLEKVAAATNVFLNATRDLTNISAIASDIRALSDLTSSGITNLTSLTRASTNMLGAIGRDVQILTNAMISVVEPGVRQLTNAITTVGLSSLARILSRPDAVALGSTNTLLYKSAAGYDSSGVRLQVTSAEGGGLVFQQNLAPLGGVAGLYETSYVADWPLGRYRVTVTDPKASDSCVLRVVSGDLYALPGQLGSVSNQLADVESRLVNMSRATDSITNDLLPRLNAIDGKLTSLSTGDLSFIQYAVAALTNQLATFADMSNVAVQVSLLTNSVGNIQALTNLSQMVSQLTNALNGVDWSDVKVIRRDVATLTNGLSGANWGDVLAIRSDLRGLSNLVGGDVVGQLAALTNAMGGVNFKRMQNDVLLLTNKLLRVDFTAMERNLQVTTNRLAGLSALDGIGSQLAQLSNSLTQISALTNMAPTVTALGAKLLPIDFAKMEQNLGVVTNTLAGVEGLQAIAGQLAGLSNAVTALSAVTNLSSQVGDMWTELQAIDMGTLAYDMSVVTNTLSNLRSLSDISAQIGELSNALSAISGVTNLNRQVEAIYTNVNAASLAQMASDLRRATNQIASLNTSAISAQLNFLSNQVVGVSRDMGVVTNRLNAFSWGVITGIEAKVGQIISDMGALTNLSEVADAINNLSNSISRISGITNLGTEVNNITNALEGLDWGDVLYIRARVDLITNQLQALDRLGDLSGVTNAVGDLTGAISGLGQLTNMPSQLAAIGTQLGDVDFRGLSNSVSSILTQVGAIDWPDVENIQTGVTNIVAILGSLGDLPGMIGAVSNLTGSIGDLTAVTNLSEQVSQIASAVVGVDFRAMTNQIGSLSQSVIDAIRRDTSSITNTLARSRLDLLPSVAAGVNALSNQLSGVDFALLPAIQADTIWLTNQFATLNSLGQVAAELQNFTNALGTLAGVTNLGAQVGDITNALQGINWADIEAIRTGVFDVSNRVAQMGVLLTVPDQLTGLSNSVEGLSGLTNLQTMVGSVVTNLSNVDWGDIAVLQTQVGNISTQLTQLAGLDGVVSALYGLSNSIVALQGITNIGAEVSSITNILSGLSGLDWQDVLDIKSGMGSVTNQLSGLSDALAKIDGLTNAIGGMGDLAGLEAKVGTLTNQLSGANWADVRDIQRNVSSITNSLSGLSELATISAQLNDVVTSLNDVTNLSTEVATLSSTFATADWGDVTKIQTTIDNLGTSLTGLSGVDLTTFDPRSLTRMEGTLQSMATVNVVDEIQRLMGQASDKSSANTFFGRLSRMELELTNVGLDAKNAAQRAQSAKTKASDAASSISTLQTAIESGDLLKAVGAIRQIQDSLRATQAELERVPKDVDPSSVYKTVRQMADAVNALATSKGFPKLLEFDGGKGAAEGGGLDPDLAKQLNLQIQEVRAGMEFMQELMDEMRYEPVVHESLLGVE